MRRAVLLFAFFALLAFTTVFVVSADSASPSPPSPDGDSSPSVPTDVFTPEERSQMETGVQKLEFQAEVTRLMDIIINSLYSKREIFVRELISNAADALDKIRYLSLTGQQTLGEGPEKELEIRISYDKDARLLRIRDTGVGMTKEDLVKNLGIVARSGTTEFVEAATKGSDSEALSLIGQFGVGFYSVYLAADKVTVVSKNPSDEQYVWESTAEKTFTVAKDPRGNTLGRGTEVILHLKEDATDFANEHELKKLVEKYSEFINYPIYLYTTKKVEKEVPVEPEEKKGGEDSSEEKKEGEDGEELEAKDEEDEKPKTKKEMVDVSDWERLNDVKAIWTRSPKDITEEEYQAFYKTLTKDDTNGALSHIHFTAEGEITFRSILYVPKKAPSGLYDKFYEKSTALKLYVRRVLISDEFEDFLPRYLNFIKGVVDSEDLPLNVSRETLAQNRVLKVMSKKITRKVLEMLKRLADSGKEQRDKKRAESTEEAASSSDDEDKEKVDDYTAFWKNFGKSLKLGVIDDRQNKAKLAKLLRFQTTKSGDEFIGLEEYVEKMKSKQKHIYYITGESIEHVKQSPFLERLRSKDFDVIYMVDPLDEYLVQSMTEFDGTPLASISKEGLKLGDEDKLAKYKDEYKEFTNWMKEVYGERVEKVVVSNRIAQSPCVLVTGQYGWSANMERIMKAQTFSNAGEAKYMLPKKTLEINPRHPIIKEMKSKSESDKDDKALIDLAHLLYDAALMQSGFSMTDTADFASRIQRVVSTGLNVDPNAQVEPESDEPETEEESARSTSDAGENAEAEEHAQVHDAHDEL